GGNGGLARPVAGPQEAGCDTPRLRVSARAQYPTSVGSCSKLRAAAAPTIPAQMLYAVPTRKVDVGRPSAAPDCGVQVRHALDIPRHGRDVGPCVPFGGNLSRWVRK